MEDEKENKRRFQLWIKPSVLELAEKNYYSDNCESKSEYIEKAIKFYSGFVMSKGNSSYLPNVVTSTLKGIVADSTSRQNKLLFKLSVELAVIENILATDHNISSVVLERLRGECVKEVKRLNGTFSFEDAVEWQKG